MISYKLFTVFVPDCYLQSFHDHYTYTQLFLIATGVKEICKEAGGEDQKVFDIF